MISSLFLMGPWFAKVSPTFSITTSCLSEVCFRVEYDNIGLHHPPIFRLPFEKNARTSDQIHSCYTYGKRKICFSEKNQFDDLKKIEECTSSLFMRLRMSITSLISAFLTASWRISIASLQELSFKKIKK